MSKWFEERARELLAEEERDGNSCAAFVRQEFEKLDAGAGSPEELAKVVEIGLWHIEEMVEIRRKRRQKRYVLKGILIGTWLSGWFISSNLPDMQILEMLLVAPLLSVFVNIGFLAMVSWDRDEVETPLGAVRRAYVQKAIHSRAG